MSTAPCSADCPTDCPTDCPADCPTDCPTDYPTDCPTDHQQRFHVPKSGEHYNRSKTLKQESARQASALVRFSPCPSAKTIEARRRLADRPGTVGGTSPRILCSRALSKERPARHSLRYVNCMVPPSAGIISSPSAAAVPGGPCTAAGTSGIRHRKPPGGLAPDTVSVNSPSQPPSPC